MRRKKAKTVLRLDERRTESCLRRRASVDLVLGDSLHTKKKSNECRVRCASTGEGDEAKIWWRGCTVVAGIEGFRRRQGGAPASKLGGLRHDSERAFGGKLGLMMAMRDGKGDKRESTG